MCGQRADAFAIWFGINCNRYRASHYDKRALRHGANKYSLSSWGNAQFHSDVWCSSINLFICLMFCFFSRNFCLVASVNFPFYVSDLFVDSLKIAENKWSKSKRMLLAAYQFRPTYSCVKFTSRLSSMCFQVNFERWGALAAVTLHAKKTSLTSHSFVVGRVPNKLIETTTRFVSPAKAHNQNEFRYVEIFPISNSKIHSCQLRFKTSPKNREIER